MAEAVEYYSTVNDVLEDTGLGPEDLGFTDDEEGVEDGKTAQEKLEAKIIKWLIEAKAIINEYKKRDFAAEVAAGTLASIPVCISSIAKRIAINMSKQAIINRETPIVTRDDYSIQLTNDTIVTRALYDELDNCMVQTASTSFNLFAVTSEEFEPYDDEYYGLTDDE